MGYSPLVATFYEESRKDEFRSFVQIVCESSCFSDDRWVCNRLARTPCERKGDLTLSFSKVPKKYTELVKYYSITQLMERKSIKGIQNAVAAFSMFFYFLDRTFPKADWKNCGVAVTLIFKDFLDGTKLSEQTKHNHWQMLNAFFRTMSGWENAMCRNPFTENPYTKMRKYDAKYIPQDIANKLDNVFRGQEIPCYLRCIYWLLRLIPSRISEVLAMKLDCLKPYNGHYCLFIPTWKQNGGHIEPEMRVIHLENTGVASELIRLVREQQIFSQKIQERLKSAHKGFLFVYQKTIIRKNGVMLFCNEFLAVHDEHVNKHFRRICECNGVLGEDGEPYQICTHQFRHNGITDRLAAGFTPEQIRFMTAHHGDAMIYQAYNHLNLLPETIRQKQAYVLKEPVDEGSAILFGGRILNMEDQLEKRLLKNIRAHRVMGGICGDITGCKGDMTRCLECDFFIPDASQLSFYEAQAASWYVKANKFALYPHIKDAAVRNAELFENIAQKIHCLEEMCYE